jgi:predicted ester cyclase
MEDPRISLVHRFFDEVWNQKREETIHELLTPDVVAHGLGEKPANLAEFIEAWLWLLDTFTQFHVEVTEVIASGDFTAARLDVRGIHTGPGLGVPPTGKPVHFSAQTYNRWRAGQIAEGWNTIDMASVYRQIGAHIALD